MSHTSPSMDAPHPSPASGLFRVFPYEPISWRQRIRQSGLPADAQNLIGTVVRKSRLMRFEKIEVVQELISHFLEGRQSGQSYPQLVANFGDPQVTAALIRRSKIRNRPIMMKIFSICACFLVAAIGVYMSVFAFYHMGRPTPNTDYMVDLNALSQDVQERDKAWPIYRPLWIRHGFSEGGAFGSRSAAMFHQGEQDSRYSGAHQRLARPGDPEWPAAVSLLQEVDDLLDAFRAGAQRSRLGLELQSDIANYSDEDFAALFPALERGEQPSPSWKEGNGPASEVMDGAVINILLPHVHSFRNAARLFQLDSRWAVERNDPDRVVLNIETMLGLANQASDTNLLVGSLVANAIAAMAFNVIEEVVVDDPDFLTDDQLVQIQNRLESFSIRDLFTLDGERAMMHDIIQRVFTDDGNGDGRITPVGLKLLNNSFQNRVAYNDPELPAIIPIAMEMAAPASLFLLASRKETTDKYEELIDSWTLNFDKPAWEIDTSQPQIDDFLEQNATRFKVLNLLMPALGLIKASMIRTEGRKEGVIAALAINRYRLKYDQWPDTFDQVAPEFVTRFPIDQLTGNFLNFTFVDDGLLIYSVGNDRDDDGGQMIVDRQGNTANPAHFIFAFHNQNSDAADGDWILWPQGEPQKVSRAAKGAQKVSSTVFRE